ncbi:hypothetical protein B0T16DRAFT_423822 [Cercophora newfieldiana]|uniref:Uncharacterized protein n=1 Tax=Cercophora newfieldiana TaxID=92897 RepID=A0AA39XTB5_9PEZI|nr:hypothetical protein B0T16DRAFT_423822 [Cercophora newfieldiana]
MGRARSIARTANQRHRKLSQGRIEITGNQQRAGAVQVSPSASIRLSGPRRARRVSPSLCPTSTIFMVSSESHITMTTEVAAQLPLLRPNARPITNMSATKPKMSWPSAKPQGITKPNPFSKAAVRKSQSLKISRLASRSPSTTSIASDDSEASTSTGLDSPIKFPLELILPELGLTLHPGQHRTHPFLHNPATAALFPISQLSTASGLTPPNIPRLVRARLLETLILCHDWRDMLWRQALPSPLFWQQVAIHAPWSRRVNWSHLRDLILSIISQITLMHVQLARSSLGRDVRRMTTISVAALRAARDMDLYEQDRKRGGTRPYLMSSHVRFKGEWALDGFVRTRKGKMMEGMESMTQEEAEWLKLLFLTGEEQGLWWWIKGLGVGVGAGTGVRKGSEESEGSSRRSSWLETVLDSDSDGI